MFGVVHLISWFVCKCFATVNCFWLMYFRNKIIRYCVEQKLNISVQTYADFWRIGHFNDTILYTGGLSGTSAWGSILNTSVKRPNKRQRGRILNQQWDTDKSSAFNFSNNDNIWRKNQSIPNIVTFFSSLAIKFKHNFNRNMAKTRWKMTFNDFLPPPLLDKVHAPPPLGQILEPPLVTILFGY